MGLSAAERAFAAEVERCRAAARVTQEWIARRIGLSRPKVSEMCNGLFLPSHPALDALVEALAMNRERTFELWRAAEQGRNARRQAERMAQHARPEGWDALPVLPPGVQSLLRAQAQVAQELPYRLPGARRPSLATVYVRQDLGSPEDPHPEQARPEPLLDERGRTRTGAVPLQRPTVRPPSCTLRAALDDDDHLVVTGGPGQGKSTLSLRLAADIVEAWTPSGSPPPLVEPVVPLRLTARELAARLDVPFGEALAAGVRSEYGSLLRVDLSAHLLSERVAGRWLLLIDGLDEVADGAERDRLVTVLAALAADSTGSPYRILLTTRPLEDATLGPLQRAAAARYELQTFDEQALHRFADNWFVDEGPETAKRFVRQLREAHLTQLAQIPLMATIAAIVFQQHADRPLPDNQYELYESYLLFLRSVRQRPPGPYEHLTTGLLEHLSRVRVEAGAPLAPAARSWVAERVPPERRSHDWHDEIVSHLAAVGPLVIRDGDLRFLHHSFAEHMAATATARLLPEKFDPEHTALTDLLHTAQHSDRGGHARTVLLHYVRLHPAEADPVVDWLHRGPAEQHLLAARLLAQHAPTSPHSVDAFLATVRRWAMTTQYLVAAILDQVSRATHHPGLGPWLADIADDSEAPWESRTAAASALATRLRGPHRPMAVAALRSALTDDDVAISARLTAAEALAQCGAEERLAAEHGLTMLLAHPGTTPRGRRNAAVILATLGRQAHDHAAAVLCAAVDDPDTLLPDLVESAAGLAEIGPRFHDAAVRGFRTVLHEHAPSLEELQEAAVGLAALGGTNLEEAGAALITVFADYSRDAHHRIDAAKALVELGPQYRGTTADLLLKLLAEPGVDVFTIWSCATALSELGAEFRPQAATHLRRVVSAAGGNTNAAVWAATHLAELGPEFHREAAGMLRRIAADPRAHGFDHAYALRQLALLGPDHREFAISRLRADLFDPEVSSDTRQWAAQEIVTFGPEFHAEACEALLRTTRERDDARAVWSAWSTLTNLDRHHVTQASHALLALLGSPHTSPFELVHAARVLGHLGHQHAARGGEALAALLASPDRCTARTRLAMSGLADLGEPYRHVAIQALRELRVAEPWRLTGYEAPGFARLGARQLAEIIDTLRAVLRDPITHSDHLHRAARTLIRLGMGQDPEVAATLRALLTSGVSDSRIRVDAALDLAMLGPHHVPEAIETLHRLAESVRDAYTLEEVLITLARLGADAVSVARRTAADQDAEWSLRQTAVAALPRLDPALTAEAVTELRLLADDPWVDFSKRSDALAYLVEWDGSLRDDALAPHRDSMNDEDESVEVRCSAALGMVRLDPESRGIAVAVIRRLSDRTFATVAEQQTAASALRSLQALRPREGTVLALAVFHHPRADFHTRNAAAAALSGPERLEAERALLTDRSIPIRWRVPTYHHWLSLLPAQEAEDVIREELTCAEASRRERLEAAAALAQATPRFVPEASALLEEMTEGWGSLALHARRSLAALGDTYHQRVVRSARHAIDNTSLTWRERYAAADLVTELAADLPAEAVAFLRRAAKDNRTSDHHRVTALYSLRRVDGLSALRAIRDGHPRLVCRCRAANLLTRYSTGDRAAAAQLWSSVADDVTARPALRLWAARSLATRLGAPGRQAASRALGAMAADAALPVCVRGEAASNLAQYAPSRYTEALSLLYGLARTEDPWPRWRVLCALGTVDPAFALPALRTMAHDRNLGAVLRLRAVESLTDLSRDQREMASQVARELMHEPGTPHHVRMRAARRLARWSALGRQEARDVLLA